MPHTFVTPLRRSSDGPVRFRHVCRCTDPLVAVRDCRVPHVFHTSVTPQLRIRDITQIWYGITNHMDDDLHVWPCTNTVQRSEIYYGCQKPKRLGGTLNGTPASRGPSFHASTRAQSCCCCSRNDIWCLHVSGSRPRPRAREFFSRRILSASFTRSSFLPALMSARRSRAAIRETTSIES
jgi:hypothetical protein